MKNIINKILHPGFRAVALIVVTAVPITIVGLLLQDHPFSYFAYLYSAFALLLFCANIGGMVRHIKELVRGDQLKILVKFRELMNRREFTARYLNDKDYRATVALYSGQLVNLLYAAYKLSTGIYYDSSWLWAGGIYYAVIFMIRFILTHDLRTIDKNAPEDRSVPEFRAYRKCGILLLLLSLAMSGMTIQMIVNNKHNSYTQSIVIITALFTFIYFFSAVGKLVSFSKRSSPILKASKNLSVTAAVMSMYSLQTAMIPIFGGSSNYQQTMNTITGTLVMLFSVGMAVYMIVRSTVILRKAAPDS